MLYRFENCQLDINRRELVRDGARLGVRSKVFDLLRTLVEQRERVVSKDELLDQVWPGRCISETTMSSCIKELRKALNDSGREQRVVRTVHGTGFRFVAPVEALAAGAAEAGDDPGHTASPPREPAGTVSAPAFEHLSPTGERRALSVLQCALHAGDGLDVEARHYAMQELSAVAQAVIKRFDGCIIAWARQGFIAVFGVPVARDDHARRALLAANELVLRCSQPPRLAVACGLASGDAIVSAAPSEALTVPRVTGNVIDVAVALQLRAGAGQIVIDRAIYGVLRADLRASALLGSDDALLVEHIDASQAGVPRRFRRAMSPMAGRREELALLHQRLGEANAGRGQVVALLGEAGIGKSRLRSELRRALSSSDICWLQAYGLPESRDSSHCVLRELLRRRCGIDQDDSEDAARARIEAQLAAAGLGQHEALPLMLQLLRISHDGAARGALNAQAQRERLFYLLRQFLPAPDRTTVIAVEDVHWLDASSASWLAGFASQLVNRRVLLLLTSREEPVGDWTTLPWASRVSLAPLSRDECLQILSAAPRAAAFENQMLSLASRSAGNPFFLEELALFASADVAALPTTIHAVLAARIDRLTPACRQVLHTAAVIGSRGPVELLRRVCGLKQDAFDVAIESLAHAELLFEDYRAGGQDFEFKNELVREVSYSSQLGGARVATHQRIAAEMRDAMPLLAAQRPGMLAHHYAAAGEHASAVQFWRRAARLAQSCSAFVEATRHAERGLDSIAALDDRALALRAELPLQLILGGVRSASVGYCAQSVEATWQRASELSEQLGDTHARFQAVLGLCKVNWARGRFDAAFASANALLKLAREARSSGLSLRARATMGELLAHNGRPRAARRHLDECMRLLNSKSGPDFSQQAAAIAATCYASWVYWMLDEDAQALRYADEALRMARAAERPLGVVIALALVAELQRFRNDAPAALALASECVELAREQALPFWLGCAQVTQGWAQAHVGNDDDGGVDTIEEGIELFRSTGATVQLASWYGALADALRVRGQVEQARAATDTAIGWARETGDLYRLKQLSTLREQVAAGSTVACI